MKILLYYSYIIKIAFISKSTDVGMVIIRLGLRQIRLRSA